MILGSSTKTKPINFLSFSWLVFGSNITRMGGGFHIRVEFSTLRGEVWL